MLLQRTRRLLRVDERTAPIETFSLRAFTTSPLLHQWRRLRSRKQPPSGRNAGPVQADLGGQARPAPLPPAASASAPRVRTDRVARVPFCKAPLIPRSRRYAGRGDGTALHTGACLRLVVTAAPTVLARGGLSAAPASGVQRATDRPYRREPPPCAHAGAGRRNLCAVRADDRCLRQAGTGPNAPVSQRRIARPATPRSQGGGTVGPPRHPMHTPADTIYQTGTRSAGARYSVSPAFTANAAYHASILRTVLARYSDGA